MSSRYEKMTYRRCGKSGCSCRASRWACGKFGDAASQRTARELVLRAFDLGITHFDLANNYGPRRRRGKQFRPHLRDDLASHRDAMIISTKAGYPMWTPLRRLGIAQISAGEPRPKPEADGLDYVDIFYHHRPDRRRRWRDLGALDHAVRRARRSMPASPITDRRRPGGRAILRKLGTRA